MITEIADIFWFLDGIFTQKDVEKIKNYLILSDMEISPRRYLSFSFALSFFISIFIGIFALLIFNEYVQTLCAFFASFALSFFLLKNIPYLRSKERAEKIEAELPALLRSMGVLLNINLPFEKTLKHAVETDYGIISDEFRKVLREIEFGGLGVSDALRNLSKRVDSTVLKRVVAQLIFAYEQGTNGEALKKLADEMIEVQKARGREWGARLAFLGLLFIAIGCIVPAFFNVYVIVGSSFLYSSFSPLQIWLIFLLVFPLLNLLIISYIKLKSPKAFRTETLHFLSKEELKKLQEILYSMGIHMSLPHLFLCLFSLSFIISAYLLLTNTISILPLSVLIFFSPLLLYLILEHTLEKRNGEIERYLPDALFQSASFQRGMEFERILHSIAKSGYGALSEEFQIAYNQIRSGASVPSALLSISKRTNSILLDRAIKLIVQGYITGADMCHALRETAEDVFETFSVVRERASALSIQKYTLLFGGGFLVPLILGTVVNVVFTLNFSGIEGMEGFYGIGAAEREEMIFACINASQVYLLIYSLLSSIFIAQQEGQNRKCLLYFALLAPTTILLFNLAKTTDIFSLM